MALKHNLRIKKHNWTNKFNISEHHLLTKHKIDWGSAECVTYITNCHLQLTLESWYTNLKQKPLNRCQKLPAPYKRLIHDLKWNRYTSTNNKRIENNRKTTTDQSLQFSHFDDQSHHDKTAHSKPRPGILYSHLTTTLHLTLKMTTVQIVETSVTNNSLSKDYLHLDDHARQTIDKQETKYITLLLVSPSPISHRGHRKAVSVDWESLTGCKRLPVGGGERYLGL